jgi:thioredoxin reductase (NADPH)
VEAGVLRAPIFQDPQQASLGDELLDLRLEREGDAGGALKSADGAEARRAFSQLFCFIGADANARWLIGSQVALDPRGFVLTGPAAGPGERQPLETSRPGVFAIGDVRSGSTKRVSAAAGEGAQVVAAVLAHLADTRVA